MATRVSTRSSVWKFHLWNSSLLFQVVIKIDFSSSILFFCKRKIDFSQTNCANNCANKLIIALFISQAWFWNIRNLNIWVTLYWSFGSSLFLSYDVWTTMNLFFRQHDLRCWLWPLLARKHRSHSAHISESLFASVLAFANLSDPVFDVTLLHNLCN